MKRIHVTFVNVGITIIFAVLAGQFGLFALCKYNPVWCSNDYAYWIVGASIAAITTMVFFWHQYDATKAMIQPRRKPMPHVMSQYKLLERTERVVWNVWDLSGNKARSIELSDLEDYGWVVEFDSGYPVVVSQKEFYSWLLSVSRNQHILEGAGKSLSISPLSQRQNSDISRKTLEAYIALLELVYAIDYVNANVKRLKPDYAMDVWTKIIKPLERQKPMVRV